MYTFKFDKRQELGMVIPVWQTEFPSVAGWTSFRLGLSPNTDRAALAARLKAIQPSILLFLRKLRHIGVRVDGETRHYQRRDLPNCITQVKHSDGQVQNYLMVNYIVNAGTLPYDPKREGVTQSTVILAFPISSSRAPVIRDQFVHAFLPIRTYPIPVSTASDLLGL